MEFQYRKRYGLHAIRLRPLERNDRFLFQYRKRYGLHAISPGVIHVRDDLVSIPQAVWIACNFKFLTVTSAGWGFQYRKRYGLHAIGNGHA